jgi:hypothetical protein
MSPEPTRTKQEIVLKGFPMRRHKRDFLVGAVFTLENVISLNIWPLFLGVFILLTNTYISIGILASVSTAVAISTIYIIGKLIDKSQGRKLLNIGAIGNAILHTLRPFVTTFTQAFGINLLNVPLTSMYRMPFMKGLYDASDSVPGYRIVYFLYYEWYTAIANIIFWSYLFLISYYFGDFRALQSAFIVGAVLSLLITKQKFAALK